MSVVTLATRNEINSSHSTKQQELRNLKAGKETEATKKNYI